MKALLKTDQWKEMNIGFALDEGLANPNDAYRVYYAGCLIKFILERAPLWTKIVATGAAGHGSQFIDPNATIRVVNVINKFLEFREMEKQRLFYSRKESGAKYELGDVTV